MVSYCAFLRPDERDGGFWTEVLALPCCGSQGETVDEAVEMTKDAIEGYIASLKKHGEPVPEELAVVITVSVEV